MADDCIGSDVSWAKAPTAPKSGFSAIPMWVADMSFSTVPTIPQEIIKRAGREGALAQPDLYRLHTRFGAQSAGEGRKRCLAHGLRRYGRTAREKSHSPRRTSFARDRSDGAAEEICV